jgi:acyl-coenzyme A synthetase/AMP-(fatty) acid ligase
MEGAHGGHQPWLAIVRDGEVDQAAIAQALAPLAGLPTVKVAWIEAIPRTPMGKARREELRAAARRLPA